MNSIVIGDPSFDVGGSLGEDMLRQMMDNANLSLTSFIGVDPGELKGDRTAMATFSTASEIVERSTLTVGKIMELIKSLEGHLMTLPLAPFIVGCQLNKVHKKRRNQTEAYHRRVQKKWTKRFGYKYGDFVVKPINPWDMYLPEPPERKVSTGMELMMQSMLSVPRYPAMLPSDSVLMINSIA